MTNRSALTSLALAATTALAALGPVAAGRRAEAPERTVVEVREPAPRPASDAPRPSASRERAAKTGGGGGAPAPDTGDVQRVRRGCDLVAEYFGEAPGPAPAADAPARPRPSCARLAGLAEAHAAVEPPVIVVLPDPLDSRLDWAYDGGLEAVRRAYERAGFLLDRFWLPWPADADSARRRDARRPADSTFRRANPGVLLFRRAADADADADADTAPARRRPLQLVYVVGELATGGINQVAFDSAVVDRLRVLRATRAWPARLPLDSAVARASDPGPGAAPPASQVARGPRPAGAAPLDTLRVVGPIFSGSVPSLHRRLRAWTGGRGDGWLHALVVSGGATAAANKRAFDAAAPLVRTVARAGGDTVRVPCADLAYADPDPTVTFWATLNPVDSLLAVTQRVLREQLNIPLARVAVLREASTAFGAAAGGGVGPGGAGAAPAAAGECRAPPPAPRPPWFELPVPMNISRLRGELLRTLASSPALPGAAPQAARAPLDLQDPATARENVPLLSTLSTPSAERTLEDIAQTLLAHRVGAVVIVATDVRDRIFLANEVRTRLRDVKVVVVGSHSLFLRPEVNETLRGTLVVSTYPVFLEPQFWDGAGGTGRQRFAFTGDVSEGTFNAALVQLGADSAVTDYGAPLAGLAADTGAAARDALVPPVWLTTIGRGALLPVQAYPLRWAADSAFRAMWYVYPRPAAPAPAGQGPAPVASADALPNEAPMPGVEPGLLGVALALALLGIVGAFRVSDGAPVLGWDPPLRRSARERAAAALVGRTPQPPVAAVVPVTAATAYWTRVLDPLRSHARAWSVLRVAGLFAVAAPVALLLMRSRIHGAAPWHWVAVCAVGATAFVVVALVLETVRVHWSWRPVLVMVLALVYVALVGLWVLDSVGPSWGDLDGSAGAQGRAAAATFLARALQLGSGVSPLVPLLVGGLLVLFTAAWHRRRIGQMLSVPAFEAACAARLVGAGPAERGATPDDAIGSPGHLAEAVRAVRDRLHELTPSGAAKGALAFTLGLAFWIVVHIERTPESAAVGALARALHLPWTAGLPSAFDVLFRLLLGAGFVIGGWTLVSFVTVWQAFRRVLQSVQVTALDTAAGRLPELLPGVSRLTPFSTPDPHAFRAAVAAGVAARLAKAGLARAGAPAGAPEGAEGGEGRPGADPPAGDPADHASLRPGRRSPEQVAAAGEWVGAVYAWAFAPPPAASASAAATAAAPAPAPARPLSLAARPDTARRHAAQEIVALYFVDYAEWVIRHLRRLAFGLLAGLALTTFLLSSYPFEPQSLVKATFFVLMVAAVGAVLAVLVQMNRDPVLSAVTHTDPGEVTWNAPFVVNLVAVGAVPVLTLLGTQFPEVRDFLFSWVTPILRTIGRN